mmetsp:Transcript_39093/g.96645  ORF Transcript_39093/g.96645 Transcript_39093/m.96645 type:complete len:240 (+) Transcript_39093:2085-2804(+)
MPVACQAVDPERVCLDPEAVGVFVERTRIGGGPCAVCKLRIVLCLLSAEQSRGEALGNWRGAARAPRKDSGKNPHGGEHEHARDKGVDHDGDHVNMHVDATGRRARRRHGGACGGVNRGRRVEHALDHEAEHARAPEPLRELCASGLLSVTKPEPEQGVVRFHTTVDLAADRDDALVEHCFGVARNVHQSAHLLALGASAQVPLDRNGSLGDGGGRILSREKRYERYFDRHLERIRKAR